MDWCACSSPQIGETEGRRYCKRCQELVRPPDQRSERLLEAIGAELLKLRRESAEQSDRLRRIEAALCCESPQPDLVDANEIARRCGVSARYVREHAEELGAVRLGDGPRGRLRFDPARAETAVRRNGAG